MYQPNIKIDLVDITKDKIFKNNAVSIDFILEDIKICDPAIGSGAFAVGIVNLIQGLDKYFTPVPSGSKGIPSRDRAVINALGTSTLNDVCDFLRTKFASSVSQEKTQEQGGGQQNQQQQDQLDVNH